MQWVLNHLGHTLDVHKIHYRQTSSVVERIQIAKILLLQDNNRVQEFANKSLREIQLTDLVFASECTTQYQKANTGDREDVQEIIRSMEATGHTNLT